MEDEFRVTDDHVTTVFTTQKASPWRCHIGDNFYYTPPEGTEPNRFHRFMQRLVLGFRWEYVEQVE